jgi:hypothetical protein
MPGSSIFKDINLDEMTGIECCIFFINMLSKLSATRTVGGLGDF